MIDGRVSDLATTVTCSAVAAPAACCSCRGFRFGAALQLASKSACSTPLRHGSTREDDDSCATAANEVG